METKGEVFWKEDGLSSRVEEVGVGEGAVGDHVGERLSETSSMEVGV